MNAFEPILAWAVIEPCGKLALFSIAATPDQAKEFFLGSGETEGWNALETVGVHVVAITIKPSQGKEHDLGGTRGRHLHPERSDFRTGHTRHPDSTPRTALKGPAIGG
jgi:hypothetical protein